MYGNSSELLDRALYIVFILDHLHTNAHDGQVFRGYGEAKKFLIEEMEEYPEWKRRGVIGMFTLEPRGEMNISYVESFGFPGDKKEVEQLELFKPAVK